MQDTYTCVYIYLHAYVCNDTISGRIKLGERDKRGSRLVKETVQYHSSVSPQQNKSARNHHSSCLQLQMPLSLKCKVRFLSSAKCTIWLMIFLFVEFGSYSKDPNSTTIPHFYNATKTTIYLAERY